MSQHDVFSGGPITVSMEGDDTVVTIHPDGTVSSYHRIEPLNLEFGDAVDASQIRVTAVVRHPLLLDTMIRESGGEMAEVFPHTPDLLAIIRDVARGG